MVCLSQEVLFVSCGLTERLMPAGSRGDRGYGGEGVIQQMLNSQKHTSLTRPASCLDDLRVQFGPILFGSLLGVSRGTTTWAAKEPALCLETWLWPPLPIKVVVIYSNVMRERRLFSHKHGSWVHLDEDLPCSFILITAQHRLGI